MDSSSEANMIKKLNIRKGKVEIKKVEEKSKRCVTFSKRKQGLFNKVTALSLLCQAETAVVITSQKGKIYACGYPDPDSVISRYYGGGRRGGYHNVDAKRRFREGAETLRLKYEATEAKLKEVKMQKQTTIDAKKNGLALTELWDLPNDDVGFEQVEESKNCMEDFKMKLVAARERKKKIDNSLPSFEYMSFLNEGFSEHDAWDCGVSSMVPRDGFGHY